MDANHNLQIQVLYFASFDIRPLLLEYLELETSICCKNQCFWIPDSKTYQPIKFEQKMSSYERDISFLRQPINSANIQVL
jgi:hypothetical protein